MSIKPEDLRLYKRLADFCWDDYYFPMDGQFQNYTYFPPATPEQVRSCWKRTLRLIREGRAPREVGLYVHWPFCPSQCSYCFCSMRVPKSRKETADYAAGLKGEMDSFRDVFDGFKLTSLWFGGGTPTFMDEDTLDGLLGHARRCFALEPGAEIYVEASPATLSPGKMDVLLRHGVNRITLGIQSRDESVPMNRRGQDAAAVERAASLVFGRGMVVDFDLMMGLQGQSELSFLRDLAWALRKKPDVLHLFAFDPRPQTLFSKSGKEPGPRRDLHRLMALADRAVRGAGYGTSRLDPKTLEPHRLEEKQDSAVRRLGASVLGIGNSALSHAFGSAWYYHPLRSNAFRLMPSPLDEEMRGFALRHLSLFGRLPKRPFDPGLSGALRDLEAAGHLRSERGALVYTRRDPVEKAIVLKHLYSRKVREALARIHHPSGGGIREKLSGRGLFRVYFRSA
ncbi:MAG: radical SAM protein [Elusimicrobiota bacterium]